MTRLIYLAFVGLPLLLTACPGKGATVAVTDPTATNPAAEVAPAAMPGAAAHLAVPLVLHLRGPDKPQARAQIIVEIEVVLHGPTPGELAWQLQTPAGCRLRQPANGRLPPVAAGATGTVKATVTLELIGEAPADDFVATLAGAGNGWGISAKGAYRFGRPEPKLPSAPEQKRVESGGVPL